MPWDQIGAKSGGPKEERSVGGGRDHFPASWLPTSPHPEPGLVILQGPEVWLPCVRVTLCG